ncbi:MAG: hypothetical protein K6F51_15230 [Acetatifactor sp.]|nr:hypothetical protein [Acetatifactor sp.]
MKERRIREELTNVRELLADLFQSGLMNAPESLQKRLSREETYVRQYGMDWLADRLKELLEQLEKRRHVIGSENAVEVCSLFCKISAFVEEGIRQSGLDEAGIRISQKEWEQED